MEMSQSLSEQSLQQDMPDQQADFVSYLLDQNLLDKASVTRLRRVAEETGGRPAHILVSLGLLSDEHCCRALADFSGL